MAKPVGFVGRERELSRLEGALAGDPRLVLVVGMPVLGRRGLPGRVCGGLRQRGWSVSLGGPLGKRGPGRDDSMTLVSWLGGIFSGIDLADLRDLATDSILDINDGITSAAGIAEGFLSAGATAQTLLFAGTAVILAGGSAAGAARYSEVRTEWERNRAQIEAERASIESDPEGEFEELTGIYEAKGLSRELARQVAEALTERDPVAAHADAELRLEALRPTSGGLLAGVTAGLCYGAGAALPLAAMSWLPLDDRLTLSSSPS